MTLSSGWKVRNRTFDLSTRTVVMGILNLTPDSFSDGGRFATPEAAADAAEKMAADGADILDLGAESSRPGREPILTETAELERLLPVLKEVRRRMPEVCISVDTYRTGTIAAALDAGADVINDIYALRKAPGAAGAIAKAGAGVLLMHMQGEPHDMQNDPAYSDVLVEIRTFLRERMQDAIREGIPECCVAIDPGLGFGKTSAHNIQILAGLEYLRLLQRPICIGASRKGFLGKLTGDLPVHEREEATLAAHCAAVLNGAGIIRTHDVIGARRSLAIIDAIRVQQ